MPRGTKSSQAANVSAGDAAGVGEMTTRRDAGDVKENEGLTKGKEEGEAQNETAMLMHGWRSEWRVCA